MPGVYIQERDVPYIRKLLTPPVDMNGGDSNGGDIGGGNGGNGGMEGGTNTALYLAAGGYSYYVIRSDNTLWAWGYNGESQLGLGDNIDRALPTQVPGSWKSVAASVYNMLAIKSDGTLWGAGYNSDAVLGLGDEVPRETLTLIDGGDWSIVDTVGDVAGHSVAIKSDGTLWYTGRDVYITPIESYPLTVTFTQMGSDTNWVSASAGGDNTLLIKSDGTLWGWGANNYGELGVSPHTYQGPSGPILYENYILTPTQIGAYTDWVKIVVGTGASAGIRANGTLWTTGYNHWGLLGIGDSRVGDTWGINDYFVETFTQVGSDTNWVDVVAGTRFFVARKSNGTLWVWGHNNEGQLGLGTLDDPYYYNVPTQIGSDTDWTNISAGGLDTLAIKNNQLAFGGGNLFDYIGTGNTPQAFTVLPYSSTIL